MPVSWQVTRQWPRISWCGPHAPARCAWPGCGRLSNWRWRQRHKPVNRGTLLPRKQQVEGFALFAQDCSCVAPERGMAQRLTGPPATQMKARWRPALTCCVEASYADSHSPAPQRLPSCGLLGTPSTLTTVVNFPPLVGFPELTRTGGAGVAAEAPAMVLHRNWCAPGSGLLEL